MEPRMYSPGSTLAYMAWNSTEKSSFQTFQEKQNLWKKKFCEITQTRLVPNYCYQSETTARPVHFYLMKL
jgi:hypothetical protein